MPRAGKIAGVWREFSVTGARRHRQRSDAVDTRLITSGRISGGLERGKFGGTDAARHAPPTFAAGSRVMLPHQWRLLLLVGVSAPAVPPTTAPAAAPRPPPRIAPAAAPPPAPIPTFLARLRLPLLLLFLLEVVRLEVVRLLEVAAITGKAVSPSSPKHRTAAHSDFFIDRPSPDKICNQSAKLPRSLQSLLAAISFGTPTGDSGVSLNVRLRRTQFAPFCCATSITQNLMRLWTGCICPARGLAAFHCCGCLFRKKLTLA